MVFARVVVRGRNTRIYKVGCAGRIRSGGVISFKVVIGFISISTLNPNARTPFSDTSSLVTRCYGVSLQ